VSILDVRKTNLLLTLGTGPRSFAPEDFSHSPDRLTRLVAFQTVVAEIDALFREGLITQPDKDVKGFADAFYVVRVTVDHLTSAGMRVLDVHRPGWSRGRPARDRSDADVPPDNCGEGR
jgi:hypothetical protein